MVSKAQWTIQDYFKQAGIPLGGTRRNMTPPGVRKGSGNDFSRILAGVQADPQAGTAGARSGQRIADYRKMPVVARVARAREARALAPGVPDGPQTVSPAVAQSDAPASSSQTPSPSQASTGAPASAISRIHPAISRPRDDSVRGQIDESIEKAAADYRLPAELIRGVIQAESNFQVQAISPAGAQGLMQLMPATARELGVDDPFDIRQNIDGGARYLRQMLDMFDGDVKQALSAYNAGPGAVIKYDGQVPYPETRNYVRKVMRYAKV